MNCRKLSESEILSLDPALYLNNWNTYLLKVFPFGSTIYPRPWYDDWSPCSLNVSKAALRIFLTHFNGFIRIFRWVQKKKRGFLLQNNYINECVDQDLVNDWMVCRCLKTQYQNEKYINHRKKKWFSAKNESTDSYFIS